MLEAEHCLYAYAVMVVLCTLEIVEKLKQIVTFSVGYTVFLHPTHFSLVPPNILETLATLGFCSK